MTPTRPAGLLWAALLLAAAGALFLLLGQHRQAAVDRPEPGPEQPPAAAVLRLRSAPPLDPPTGIGSPYPPVEPLPARPIGPGAPGGSGLPIDPALLPDPLAGSVPDDYLQDLLDGGPGPSTPALSATERDAAIEVAGRVLLADLTGWGRNAFPGFWDEPARALWTDVRIQASTAEGAGLDPVRVSVTLIWAGTSPIGEPVERRRSVVTVEQSGSGWKPVLVS
ncbi:MAG: hypothetical protein L0Y54_02800 [Sporichthyaceae bacterium]|nr:hypothetical protein [Sporichthyaceae bacterium]